jgi:hypothetical protein
MTVRLVILLMNFWLILLESDESRPIQNLVARVRAQPEFRPTGLYANRLALDVALQHSVHGQQTTGRLLVLEIGGIPVCRIVSNAAGSYEFLIIFLEESASKELNCGSAASLTNKVHMTVVFLDSTHLNGAARIFFGHQKNSRVRLRYCSYSFKI